MFKRKASGDTDEGSSKEQKLEPIPRNLKPQSITLNFSNRTWEEIAPGELYYVPMCQNPRYMLDTAMMNQFEKFRDIFSTFEIHTPKVRFANLVFLQDDLRVQSNTPTDATAFTQVCYLLQYVPTRNTEYFKLQNKTDDESLKGENLTYELKPKNSQLVKLHGFNNFESLEICPAFIHENAGFVPTQAVKTYGAYNLADTYIAPNTKTDAFGAFAANLQPEDRVDQFIQNADHPTMSRNLDKISVYKYGDTIEVPIITNLEDKKLTNNIMNVFFDNVTLDVTGSGKDKLKYVAEWCWPGPNRPYFTRSSNFDSNTSPILNAKDLQPLKHHFFCMPPIKKPNGALLGQRCSVMMEQSFSVTLNFTQSVFDTEEEKHIMAQKDGIILRRNLYGRLSKTAEDPSPFCGTVGKFQCNPTNPPSPIPCPTDSWIGWDAILGLLTAEQLGQIFTVTNNVPDTYDGPYDVNYLTVGVFEKGLVNVAFMRLLNNPLLPDDGIAFNIHQAKEFALNLYAYGHFGLNPTQGNGYILSDSWPKYKYVLFNVKKLYRLYREIGIKCTLASPPKSNDFSGGQIVKENSVQHADYETTDKTINIFYC